MMSKELPFDLSEIPGLGPVRRRALEAAGICDLQSLLALRVAELSAIRGIGAWQARRIREYLRQRGLLVQDDDDEGGAVLVVHSAEDLEAIEASAAILREHAGLQADAEAEVGALREALAQSQAVADEELARASALQQEEAQLLEQGEAPRAGQQADESTAEETTLPGEQPPAAAEAPAPRSLAESSAVPEESVPAAPSPELERVIAQQREQLPEITIALMEGIRQAAVLPQLTRQLTRLLITAGEFASTERRLSEPTLHSAIEAMARAEQSLSRAVEKQLFSPAAQKDLARRIRRRRKELEALLEGE